MTIRKNESARRKYRTIDKEVRSILVQGKESTIKAIQKKAKRLNERYRQLEKQKLESSSYAYRLTRETSRQDFLTRGEKVRYSISIKRLESMTDEQLEEYLFDIESKLQSRTTKLRDLKKLNKERFEKSKQKLSKIFDQAGSQFTVTDSELLKIINSGVFAIEEYDSTQIIEDWQEYKAKGVTIEQFIKKVNEYNDIEDKEFDYISFIKRLKQIK